MSLNYQWQPYAGERLPVNIPAISYSRTETVALPFYRSIRLMRIIYPSPSSEPAYYLHYDEGWFQELWGASAPIHSANDFESVRLTPELGNYYIPFFCRFITGEEGFFYVLDNGDDPWLSPVREKIPKDILGAIKPLEYAGTDEFGQMYYSAYVLYDNALFYSNFRLFSNGLIEMIEDQPLWSSQ